MKPIEIEGPIDENGITNIIRNNISRKAFLCKSEIIEDQQYYVFGLSKQKLIRRSGGESLLTYIPIEDVFRVKFEITNDNKRNLYLPDRENVAQRFGNLEEQLIRKAEKVMMDIGSIKFLKIPNIQNSINPIKEIVVNLSLLGSLDVGKLQIPQKQKYIKFLKDLDFISVSDNKIYPANAYNKFELTDKSIKQVDWALSEIIIKGHSYLNEEMHIKHINPYLELATLYYYQCRLLDELIDLSLTEMRYQYQHSYPRIRSKSTYNTNLDLVELSEVGILNVTNDVVTGNEGLFKKFCEAYPKPAYAF